MIFSYKEPTSFNPLSFENLNKAEGVFFYENENITCTMKPPLFLDDPDNCNIFRDFSAKTFLNPRSFVLSRKNVTHIGVRTILEKGNWYNDRDYLIDKSLNNELTKLSNYQDNFLNEWTGFRPTNIVGSFFLDRRNREEFFLSGKTLVLTAYEPDNYGAFLIRVIPKLYFSKILNIEYDRIFIDNLLGKAYEICDLLDIDKEKIYIRDRNCIYHMENAFIPSFLNPFGYLNLVSQNLLRHLRPTFNPKIKGKKLYVSRNQYSNTGHSTRIMLNEWELIDALTKEGFEIICPELLSFKEQINIFSSADIVIGPSGSAMFNTVFCHPHTKIIDIESEPYWIYTHTTLFSSLDLDYSIFVGKVDISDENPIHKKWWVNIPAIINRVKSLV